MKSRPKNSSSIKEASASSVEVNTNNLILKLLSNRRTNEECRNKSGKYG